SVPKVEPAKAPMVGLPVAVVLMPDVNEATPLFVTVAEKFMSHCAPFDWAEMRTILDTDTAIAGLADNSAAVAVPPNKSGRSNFLCNDGCMAISLEKIEFSGAQCRGAGTGGMPRPRCHICGCRLVSEF
ncbi:MAG: hypothetical protein ABL897_13520, partial [Hyphomicrobium sp.]